MAVSAETVGVAGVTTLIAGLIAFGIYQNATGGGDSYPEIVTNHIEADGFTVQQPFDPEYAQANIPVNIKFGKCILSSVDVALGLADRMAVDATSYTLDTANISGGAVHIDSQVLSFANATEFEAALPTLQCAG